MKKGKKRVSDLKYLLFSGIGGYPPPPLNGQSSCPKTLSGILTKPSFIILTKIQLHNLNQTTAAKY